MRLQILLATSVLVLVVDPAGAAGDAKRGAQLFGQCMACHSVQPGEHETGPSLAHVWNGKTGTTPGFMRYSDAVKQSGVTWNETALDKWLASPAQLVPGNSMTFPGIKDPQARQDVIAYLKALDEKKAPPAKGGGGMMGIGRARLDLTEDPPPGEARSTKDRASTQNRA